MEAQDPERPAVVGAPAGDEEDGGGESDGLLQTSPPAAKQERRRQREELGQLEEQGRCALPRWAERFLWVALLGFTAGFALGDLPPKLFAPSPSPDPPQVAGPAAALQAVAPPAASLHGSASPMGGVTISFLRNEKPPQKAPEKHFPIMDKPEPNLRLYVLMVTGIKGLWKRAVWTEDLILRRAGPLDRLGVVCEKECVDLGRAVPMNMVEMPEEIPLSTGPYKLSECRDAGGHACNGYIIASLKYIYGLVAEVRRFQQANVALPKYFLVNDDDTYVHIPNMMKVMERHAPEPFEQRLAFAAKGGCQICGGAGWGLTAALALELAGTYGDRLLRYQLDKMKTVQFHYDTHVPNIIHWVRGAKIVYVPEMHPFSVLDRNLCKYKNMSWFGPCQQTYECGCAASPRPATWHMSIHYNSSWAKLSGIPG